ncbi:MAG: peroxidase, partial [Acidimicrobiales bacterium]
LKPKFDKRNTKVLGLGVDGLSDHRLWSLDIEETQGVELTLTYPASTGQNFDEILRVIDSLQLTADYKTATPVDWNHGDDVIIVPAISDEEARNLFPAGFKPIKPYLRTTPQPNL